jgi:hypothetical protein
LSLMAVLSFIISNALVFFLFPYSLFLWSSFYTNFFLKVILIIFVFGRVKDTWLLINSWSGCIIKLLCISSFQPIRVNQLWCVAQENVGSRRLCPDSCDLWHICFFDKGRELRVAQGHFIALPWKECIPHIDFAFTGHMALPNKKEW